MSCALTQKPFSCNTDSPDTGRTQRADTRVCTLEPGLARRAKSSGPRATPRQGLMVTAQSSLWG